MSDMRLTSSLGELLFIVTFKRATSREDVLRVACDLFNEIYSQLCVFLGRQIKYWFSACMMYALGQTINCWSNWHFSDKLHWCPSHFKCTLVIKGLTECGQHSWWRDFSICWSHIGRDVPGTIFLPGTKTVFYRVRVPGTGYLTN